MKRWQKILYVALVGMGLTASSLMIQPSLSEEVEGGNSRKVLYLFSTEFPPNPVVLNPSPPVQETKFWQLLDKEMQATSSLALTENMEEADYRIELRCAGVTNCSKLIVNVKNVNRDVLSSFTLKNIRPMWGLLGGSANLPYVAHELTERLDERLKQLDQGGYGYTE